MIDDKRFLGDAGHTARRAMPLLPMVEWAALPLTARLADKFVEMLIAASEVRAELEQQEAAPLAWIAPEIEEVLERIDAALQRVSS
jgi:hypothetical protein